MWEPQNKYSKLWAKHWRALGVASEGLVLNQILGAHASALASLCTALDLLDPFFKDALFFPMYPLCFVQQTHPTPGSHIRGKIE